MKTYPLLNKSASRTFAFEIDTIGVPPMWIARLLRETDGVTDVRKRRPFSNSADPDIKVQFKYLNHDFIVWEPWGDSSRYWIGPEEPGEGTPDVANLENAFRRYRSPLFEAVFEVVSLRLFKRLIGRA